MTPRRISGGITGRVVRNHQRDKAATGYAGRKSVFFFFLFKRTFRVARSRARYAFLSATRLSPSALLNGYSYRLVCVADAAPRRRQHSRLHRMHRLRRREPRAACNQSAGADATSYSLSDNMEISERNVYSVNLGKEAVSICGKGKSRYSRLAEGCSALLR